MKKRKADKTVVTSPLHSSRRGPWAKRLQTGVVSEIALVSPATSYNANPMRAFNVSLNAKKLFLAGIGDEGVLTAIVSLVSRNGSHDLLLDVGGIISPVDQHVR